MWRIRHKKCNWGRRDATALGSPRSSAKSRDVVGSYYPSYTKAHSYIPYYYIASVATTSLLSVNATNRCALKSS